MTTRVIKAAIVIDPDLDRRQQEYIIYSDLYQQGVPTIPLVQGLEYGHLMVDDYGTFREYTWIGEDRRI